jgi:hypothetical protein
VFDNGLVYCTKRVLTHISQPRHASATMRRQATGSESHRPKARLQPVAKKRPKTQGKCIHRCSMIYEQTMI